MRDGDKVIFEGQITKEIAPQLIEHFNAGARTLVITSEGGDGAAGLSIAESMQKHGVSIVVDQYCMSSCANFLFPAAKEKTLKPDAILGYHGGPTGSQDLGNHPDAIKFNASLKAFYESIHFDPALIERSFELTKLPAPIQRITLQHNGKDYVYDYKDKDDLVAYLRRFVNEKKIKDPKKELGVTYFSKGNYSNAAYFPSKAVLLAHGVTGVVDYPYPASQGELDKLGKRISDDMRLFGDF